MLINWTGQAAILNDSFLANLDQLLQAEYKTALGLKWQNVGSSKPAMGQELEHQQLCEALGDKTEFTQHEWDGFNITNLREDHFVKSGDNYFKPAAKSNRLLQRGPVKHPDRALEESLLCFFSTASWAAIP